MKDKTKKVCMITGIGGSIAIHTFVHVMKNTDWYVVGVDSFRHKGWCDRVRTMLDAHPEWSERLNLITHDLTAPFSALTISKIGKVDYILHLASLSDVEASIKDPVPFIQNNISSTINVLEYARDIWHLRELNRRPLSGTAFVMFSTDEVYGPTETMNDVYSEWSTILPSNPYAASKACQEAIAISYWRSYNLPLIITNTMNNFGEMQQSSKFPVVVQKAVESGEKIELHGYDNGDGTVETGSRSYIHSRNASDALLFILKAKQPYLHQAGKVDMPDRYNIVGDQQLNNEDFAKTIAKLMGKPIDYTVVDFHSHRPGHDKHYGLSGKKLEKMGWKSPISFDDSLKKTIEWQSANKEWIK